jgi:hypothetical protein
MAVTVTDGAPTAAAKSAIDQSLFFRRRKS